VTVSQLELVSTRVETDAGTTRLIGTVLTLPGLRKEVYFAVPQEFGGMLFDAADAFVPALLVPAMFGEADLVLRPPVSERLLGQLETIQDILVRFHGFRRARVTAQPRAGGQPGPATAVHFSGGVDSTHTLLRALRDARGGAAPPAYLLFFKGLEQPLSRLAGVDSSIAAVATVARKTGTTALVVETNLRDVFNPNYERYYHGSALAAASLALAAGVGRVVVPASYDYAHLVPWGSHPLLDPLWSTERQQIVFDGGGSRRVDKVEELVREWPESLEWLRVCLANDGGGSNCGRCRKCVRTMAALDLLDALGRAPLFPPRLPPDAAAVLALEATVWLEELQELGGRCAPRSPTCRLVERVLARQKRRKAVRSLCESTPGLTKALAGLDRLRRVLRRSRG
jgi:bacterioferritin-associated ferredoxin